MGRFDLAQYLAMMIATRHNKTLLSFSLKDYLRFKKRAGRNTDSEISVSQSRRRKEFVGRNILVIDDIKTTGTTIQVATRKATLYGARTVKSFAIAGSV